VASAKVSQLEKGLATETKNAEAGTHQWLLAVRRDGQGRIGRLGWKRLAGIYLAARPSSAVRKAFKAEARRCGHRHLRGLNDAVSRAPPTVDGPSAWAADLPKNLS
jgi:hypothetical protein